MCDFGFFPNVTVENHPPTRRNYLRLKKTVKFCDDPLILLSQILYML